MLHQHHLECLQCRLCLKQHLLPTHRHFSAVHHLHLQCQKWKHHQWTLHQHHLECLQCRLCLKQHLLPTHRHFSAVHHLHLQCQKWKRHLHLLRTLHPFSVEAQRCLALLLKSQRKSLPYRRHSLLTQSLAHLTTSSVNKQAQLFEAVQKSTKSSATNSKVLCMKLKSQP